MAAAGALVAGIVIGFFSGYEAGQRRAGSDASGVLSAPAERGDEWTAGGAIAPEEEPGPRRVDPEPIRPAPQASTEVPVEPRQAPPEPVAPPAPRQPASAPARPAPAEPARREPVRTGPGSMQVLSRPPGAEVVVDGRAVGRTPLVLAEVQAGRHEVRIELPGFRPWATTIEVGAGERARVAASLEQ